MMNDQHDELAKQIWSGNSQTIAALQDMDIADVQRIERAIKAEFGKDICLTGTPQDVDLALSKARAR